MAQFVNKQVFCSLQVEGIHFWKDCPIEEVSYLKDPHRHVFNVTAFINVSHNDRDVEFIVLKHQIQKYLKSKYWNEQHQIHWFGGMSCEMIAEELMRQFSLTACMVDEDGENGCMLSCCEVE